MGKSKIIFDGEVLMDLTQDTVTKEKLLKGTTAHGKDGEPIVGECDFDANTKDANATAAAILINNKAVVNGVMVEGEMPNIGAVSHGIASKDEEYKVPHGFHDGSGKVYLAPTEKAKLIPANIKEGVTIFGVTGEMSGTEGAKSQAKEVTPTTEDQVILPDSPDYNYLSQVTVKAIPYKETANAAGGITVTIG